MTPEQREILSALADQLRPMFRAPGPLYTPILEWVEMMTALDTNGHAMWRGIRIEWVRR
jgi:hypothetical protein